MQGYVRGAELGIEIVPVLAYAVCNLLCKAQVFVGLDAIVVTCCRYCENEMECSPQGKDLRRGVRGSQFF